MTAVIPPNPEPAPELPELELAVLRYAAAGYSVADTADELHYSSSYVKALRRRACDRLGVGSTPAAVATALRLGAIR